MHAEMLSAAELRSEREVASERQLGCDRSQLGEARRFVREAAIAADLDENATYELVFAVNEAVTNAIRHGGPDEHGLIHLGAATEGDRLTITVRDSGIFRMPLEKPSATCDHGRGLALMARFTDHAAVIIAVGETVVKLSKDRR